MGENLAALFNQRRAEGAHPPVRVDVLRVDRERLREQDLLRVSGGARRDFAHALERPREIDRSGPRRGEPRQVVFHRLPPASRLLLPSPARGKHHTVCRTDPDSGRTAHHHVLYCPRHLAGAAALEPLHALRQCALIEQRERVAGPSAGAKGVGTGVHSQILIPPERTRFRARQARCAPGRSNDPYQGLMRDAQCTSITSAMRPWSSLPCEPR